MPESGNTRRALVISGLWLHLGYIGMVAVAVGLLQLFESEPQWISALALAFFGGVLAAASGLHALTGLEDAAPTSSVAAQVSNETSSRAVSTQTGPHPKTPLPSPFSLQTNRKHYEDLRHSTPQ